MSDGVPDLDAEAVKFLLEILELRRARLSGAAAELEPSSTYRLIKAGLLVPDGHEVGAASLADHDDVPVSLIWSDQHGSLAYFSPAVGLVPVPAERLTRHAVDMAIVLREIASKLELPRSAQPHVLIQDVLWEIGDARLGDRPVRTPIWFARRLFDPVCLCQVTDAARARPHTAQRVILTSTRTSRLTTAPVPGCAVIALMDVLARFDGLAVNPTILSARLRGVDIPAQGPLVLSPDGTRLTINGGLHVQFTSAVMIDAIRQLVDAFVAGKRIPIRDLTDLGSLRRLFGSKRWALLKPYITSVNRLWGFDL